MVDGLVFDSAADAYERDRPGYPPELFDLLAERCSLGTDSTVLEIGAGPGQATATLVERGASVVAVEPGPNFARRLHERFPHIQVVSDAFEGVDLPADHFDLSLSATAFHWVDHEIGLPKIHRALRASGWVALAWNRFYDPDHPVAFAEAAQPILDQYLPGYQGSLGTVGDPTPWNERLIDAGFVDVDESCIRWGRTETTEEVVARFLTHSGPLTLGLDARRRLAGDIRALCDDRFGGRVDQAYVTVTHMGRKP